MPADNRADNRADRTADSTTEPRVFTVRHGATEWTAAGRHTGVTDIPLTDTGRRQAAGAAVHLAATRFALVLTSPLQRARETCAIVNPQTDDLQLDDDLREWDYGDYDGLTTPEIQARTPGWDLWRDGCPNGETADDVARRADRVIAKIRRQAPGPVALFAHGHLLRVLGARWIRAEPQRGASLLLDTAAVCVLDWEHHVPALRLWNLGPAGGR